MTNKPNTEPEALPSAEAFVTQEEPQPSKP